MAQSKKHYQEIDYSLMKWVGIGYIVKVTGISETVVRQMINCGKFDPPDKKLRNKGVWKKKDLDRWIERGDYLDN
jgi:predicted DNA-binding transcriptional regulator AlpA